MSIDKKRLKKNLQNCPYLTAISIIWLFLTIGGVILLWYRDYGGLEWRSLWSSPVFAVIMEKEMHGSVTGLPPTEPAMAKIPDTDRDNGVQEENKIPAVMETLEKDS